MNRWQRWLFVALIALSIVPIWAVEFQPLPDLSEHLSAVTIIHHYRDPAWDLQRYYGLSLGLEPYWGYYGLMHLLAYPFGVELANRVVLSLYIAALPVGVALLARRFGRSPALGLLAFPLIWNFNFMVGFVPCAFGIASLPFALVLFDRFCERPSWAPARSAGRVAMTRGAQAVAAGVAMYFTHLVPWVMYVAASGLVGLLHEGRSLRRILLRVCAWLPSPVFGLVAITSKSHLVAGSSARFAVRFVGVLQSVREFYDHVWNSCAGHEDELLIALLLVSWLSLIVTGYRRERVRLHDLRAEACALAALVAYFVAPRSVLQPNYWWGVNVRFATMFCLFALLCVRGEITGRRALLLVPALVAALGFVVDTTIHWVRANRFGSGFSELAKLPEPGTRVLFIIAYPWRDPSYRFQYAQDYTALYQMRRGGYMPWNFDLGFPLVYRERFPAPNWRTMAFLWDQHAPYYDYVMSFQNTPPFDGHPVTRVASAGKWTLWKLPGPRVDVPPGPAYPSAWAFDPAWRPKGR